jgi:organic radical activating enzyme
MNLVLNRNTRWRTCLPKQHNETDLQYKQRVLDPLSSSMCGAKWYNATIWLGSGMTTSCHHPLPHKVSVEDVIANPKALHNTPQKKEERRQMQCGERPKGCEYCWKVEDIGRDNISDRVYKSVIYEDNALKSAYERSPDTDVNLKTLEIAFDRTCQLACSYCNPAFSTTWVKDIKKNGAYKELISDGRNHFTHPHDSSQLYTFNETNPYIEAFFKWWESDLHHTLEELRITGGEPMMSGHLWKLLDWFKDNKGASKTRIAINSNLQCTTEKITKLLDSAPLDIYTSNESLVYQAEYIRDGLEWPTWARNMHQLAGSGKLRSLHNMCTVNALCLETLPEFLDYLLKFKAMYGRDFPSFTLNILRFPSFQSALALPDNIRTLHKDRLQEWYNKNADNKLLHEHEINQTQRLLDYLDVVKTPHSEAFEIPKLHNDFKKFYGQYDIRRNKNFEKSFPSMKEWYSEL